MAKVTGEVIDSFLTSLSKEQAIQMLEFMVLLHKSVIKDAKEKTVEEIVALNERLIEKCEATAKRVEQVDWNDMVRESNGNYN